MTTAGYHPLVRQLHWAIAGMIVLQYLLAKLADLAGESAESGELVLLANHRSIGMTILALALLRLVVRYRVPEPPALNMPGWQKTASELSHLLLYALLILLPVTGWLMSSASAASVNWFNLAIVPDLVSPDARLAEVLEDVHETFAKILLVMAGLHVAAAVKHAAFNRDGAMSRISSRTSVMVFFVVVLVGLYTLSQVT